MKSALSLIKARLRSSFDEKVAGRQCYFTIHGKINSFGLSRLKAELFVVYIPVLKAIYQHQGRSTVGKFVKSDIFLREGRSSSSSRYDEGK